MARRKFNDDPRVRRFLQRAVELSFRGMRSGCGGPFGAVVVKGDRIVGEGFNRVLADNDPTAHAEITAIRAAARKLRTFDLSGCELFASAEPCPMCLAAIYWSRAGRVYYANTVAQARAIGFDDAHFYRELKRPTKDRSVPQIHLALPEALEAFNEWRKKKDKTRY